MLSRSGLAVVSGFAMVSGEDGEGVVGGASSILKRFEIFKESSSECELPLHGRLCVQKLGHCFRHLFFFLDSSELQGA